MAVVNSSGSATEVELTIWEGSEQVCVMVAVTPKTFITFGMAERARTAALRRTTTPGWHQASSCWDWPSFKTQSRLVGVAIRADKWRWGLGAESPRSAETRILGLCCGMVLAAQSSRTSCT